MATQSGKNLQTEVDACYLYSKLAEAETDATVANVFRQMGEMERSHAEAFFIPEDRANAMAAGNMLDKNHAHDVLVKEELGVARRKTFQEC